MFKVLRIICCVISALCCTACVFAFIYAGIVWGICTIVGAAAFFALTVLFKHYQEDEEEKTHTDNNQPDATEENE